MRKQYKLVKEYPGSPKLGYIINEDDCMRFHEGCWIYSVSSSPEFWEEVIDPNPLNLEVGKTYTLQYIHCPSTVQTGTVTRFTPQGHPWIESMRGAIIPGSYRLVGKEVEKDYEILSFQTDKGIAVIQDHNIDYDSELDKIHSIKRLSDGEIFTIGDFMNYKGNDTLWEDVRGCLINSFSINYDRLYINQHWVGSEHKKVKDWVLIKPLFTTEDGVDIFEGDPFYFVRIRNFNSSNPKWSVLKPINNDFVHFEIEHDKELYFSTEEAAKEYILINKPCLSLSEILNSYGTCPHAFVQRLTKLIKPKL